MTGRAMSHAGAEAVVDRVGAGTVAFRDNGRGLVTSIPVVETDTCTYVAGTSEFSVPSWQMLEGADHQELMP